MVIAATRAGLTLLFVCPLPNLSPEPPNPRPRPPQSLDRRIASGTLPINLDASAPPPTPAPTVPPPAEDLPPPASSSIAAAAAFAPSQRALSVLDGMAVCEVAWHEGGSLPETLYACLYLHPVVFSAMLEGLGWAAAPPARLAATPRLDLRIKEGVLRVEGLRTSSKTRRRQVLNACGV